MNTNSTIEEKLQKTSKKSTEKKSENTELFRREDIPNTPFQIITDNETKEYFGTFGLHRITPKFKKKALVYDEVEKPNWNQILNVIVLCLKDADKIIESVNNQIKE